MAPNKRGGPLSSQSVVSADEVAARGSGTAEQEDSHDGSLAAEARVAATGLIFLTRLPSPIRSADHHPAYLMRSMAYFPVLGCLVGVWAAVFHAAAAVVLGPASGRSAPGPASATLASGVSTLATVWLTGCFHEDGLADCFDGFGGGWGRAQILRIMKDSRIGTYALVGMLLVLHQKLHALAAFDAATAAAALIAAHTASRWSSVPLLYFCTYIQDEEDAKKGLYNWFADSQRLLTLPRLLFATASAVLIPVGVLGVTKGLICCSAVLVVTICAGFYGNAIIGGVVGDFLGATIQVAELCCYLALLADWSVLVDGSGAWRPVLLLAFTATLPVIYCRRIIDFGPVC